MYASIYKSRPISYAHKSMFRGSPAARSLDPAWRKLQLRPPHADVSLKRVAAHEALKV